MKNTAIMLLGMMLAGCGPQSRPAPGATVAPPLHPREYTTSVKGPGGAPLAVIKCEYLGKQPEEPVEKAISRDWQTADTDFYHYAITNVSRHPITLTKIEYRLVEVRNGAVHKTATKAEIEEELGTTIIEPGSAVARRNSWVWGLNEQTRTMHKTYLGRSNNQDVKLNVVLVYRKGE